MTLSERISRVREARVPAAGDDAGDRPRVVPEAAATDPFLELRRRIHASLLSSLGPKLYDPDVTPEQLTAKVRRRLSEALDKEQVLVSSAERQRLVGQITDDIVGYGPIEPFLRDPEVTEIMVNGCSSVYVERAGRISRTDVRFHDDAHLRRIIEKIVGQVGRRIDESQPFVDARLPDGSRVNAVIPPVALDGPALTVRKFSRDPLRSEDLVAAGTVTPSAATFLQACVAGRINILVSGGTGAGKTTTLNVLSSYIPDDERIVTIEDAAELQLLQPHVVRMESRPPNIEGRGAVTIRDLVRNALRMRPDRIVVGEVRGGEALDMLQAMNTGHEGSLGTVHANSARDALSRLETMCLMAGAELPLAAIRAQVGRAIGLVVHQVRLRDGHRRITQIAEVTGVDGDVVTVQDIYLADGDGSGALQPTGLRPRLSERLEDRGLELPPSLFSADAPARASRLRRIP